LGARARPPRPRPRRQPGCGRHVVDDAGPARLRGAHALRPGRVRAGLHHVRAARSVPGRGDARAQWIRRGCGRARRPRGRGRVAGRGHRLGPAGGSPAHQRRRLRPPPGQAPGAGEDPRDLPGTGRGRGMSAGEGSTWLDRLAHDLRGPLAPLQTASYLLQREDLEPARRAELLAMLERQTQRLARMLDELDDWRRIGRGNLLGGLERSEMALLVDYGLVASGLAGTPVADDGTAAEVLVDAQRMTQVLRTLLDYSLARDGVAP